MDDISIIGNTITVNFPENTSGIEIFGTFYLSPDKYTGICDAIHDPPHSYILSPLQQFKSGIPIDEIECKDGLVIVIKNSNGNPACVKPETKTKLIERGWTLYGSICMGVPSGVIDENCVRIKNQD